MSDPLVEKLLQELKRRPGQKASELAQGVGVDRTEINNHLAHTLAGKVHQDQAYRWYLRDHTSATAGQQQVSAIPPSELMRLCRYFAFKGGLISQFDIDKLEFLRRRANDTNDYRPVHHWPDDIIHSILQSLHVQRVAINNNVEPVLVQVERTQGPA